MHRLARLHGLARLALPKDIKPTDTNSKSALSFGAISKEHTLRSKALSIDALNHIGTLSKYEEGVNKTKFRKLQLAFQLFNTLTTLEEKLNFLDCHPLGLWAFSMSCFEGFNN